MQENNNTGFCPNKEVWYATACMLLVAMGIFLFRIDDSRLVSFLLLAGGLTAINTGFCPNKEVWYATACMLLVAMGIFLFRIDDSRLVSFLLLAGGLTAIRVLPFRRHGLYAAGGNGNILVSYR